MLAQYYNSDSEDDEIDGTGSTDLKEEMSCEKPQNSVSMREDSTIPMTSNDTPIPAGILCPPPELRVIVDKTACYVLKNGKDFEDILRGKNEKRFSFLSFKDPYYKYYTFKVTGTVCPDPIQVMTENQICSQMNNRLDNRVNVVNDKKTIGKNEGLLKNIL